MLKNTDINKFTHTIERSTQQLRKPPKQKRSVVNNSAATLFSRSSPRKKERGINNVLHLPLARDAKSVQCNNAQARAIDNGAGNMFRACVVVTLSQ